MAAYRRVYDSHHLQADSQPLTAKNRDQLRNPRLGIISLSSLSDGCVMFDLLNTRSVVDVSYVLLLSYLSCFTIFSCLRAVN